MPVLGSLIASLDQQMTTASLKDVQGALGFSADEGTWVTIAYLSAELVGIPLAGYLSRAFSRRWYLCGSVVVFVLASLALSGSARIGSGWIFGNGADDRADSDAAIKAAPWVGHDWNCL